MELKEFFWENPKVAVAFSGGVDSSYLLYAAKQYAKEVRAYYVSAEFQPRFEYEDAMRLAKEIGAQVSVIKLSALAVPGVAENPANRCYYCKQGIFGAIWRAAKEDGFSVLLDGTNASDDAGDRPGMKALAELSVRSPLRECGLTKAQIRELSKEAGLFTWDKPAYACLATRIPTGEVITKEKLARTEAAEGFLFSLGFKNFRVRSKEGHARIQLPEAQWGLLMQHRAEILQELSKYYETVSLDLEVRA
ncbi:MAG: ATP-dependent sacrificial sulfur transferase LarE [Lachnospiraceae bacterium]|nr:ATP-dependent sacrificial sulfur transferase LarE [Lachnospiraceae bacterium]